MTSVADLARRDHVECGYLLVMQGVPFMFTDREELAGSETGSWIGDAYGKRRVVMGLDLRGATITYATEMGDGRPATDDSLTIKVIDLDDELIAFFSEQPSRVQIGGRLSPKMDPAPEFLIGTSGANVPIWGKWVNAESIGPAGERNYWSLFPGGDAAGFDHAAYNGDTQTLAPSYVYDAPTHLDGRRCALYRIYFDHDTQTWPSWQAHHDSGESLIWVGSLTSDAKPKHREWTLKADGPSSWLRKQIGGNRPSEWLPVSGDLALSTTPGAREDLFAIRLRYRQVNQPDFEVGASSLFDVVDDVFTSNGTASDFRTALNTRLATLAATPGPDIVWGTDRNAEASFEDGYVEIRIDELPEADGFVRAALMTVAAHTKVWRAMGFDPIVQAATNFESDFEVKFTPAANANLAAPGPGYWAAEFWTVPVGYNSINNSGGDADNSGAFRRYRAIAPQDIAQIPSKAGFELSFGIGSPGYFEGQTNRPVVEHTLSNGGGACNAQGYVALKGSYRGEKDEDSSVMVTLAQVCWRSDSVTLGGDTIGLDDDSAARVFVPRFIDARFHGIDRKPLDTTWAAPDLSYCPVNLFGHALDSGDLAHRLLTRLLISTGTAEWSGFEGGATLTPGANHPAYLDAVKAYSDTEIADLGLAVPHEIINLPSFGKATASLPGGGINSPLNRARHAWVGATDSQELIAAVLAPRGWGLGFCRNKWRLFSRPDLLTDEDVEAVITPADVVGEPEFVEAVNLRAFTPRETFAVDFSECLVSEGETEDRDLTLTVQARDPARNTRLDNGKADIEAKGLIPLPLWRGENPPPDWRSAFTTLFAESMATWYNSPQILLEGLPILPSKARELGPGTVVRLTSLYAPNREGTYGLTNKLGRVYKVEHDLETRSATVDILVQPGTAGDTRYFAPVAVVVDDVSTVEERIDMSTRTIFVKGDAFGHGEDIADCRFFVEPPWSAVGGPALCYVYTWNGRAWNQSCEFVVESVDTTANTITWADGSFSGTFSDSAYHVIVLAPWDAQDSSSWTRAYFSVLTKPDFTFGAGPTQGFPLAP